MKRPALALFISAFLAVALAQQDLTTSPPALPVGNPAPATPSDTLPTDSGLPELPPVMPPPNDTPPPPLVPMPAPALPTPSVSTPVQPVVAPTAPTPSATVPAVPRPLTLVLDVPLRGIQDGQPLVASTHLSFEIPAERAALLRTGGVITTSLEADLQTMARKAASQPKDARFEELASGWALIERDGVSLDLTKSRAALLSALKTPDSTTVNLSYTLTQPKRTVEYFTSRGITDLLATGQTNYYGSSRARITNIHVGVSKFQDHLFEGKLFSFNKELGPIDTSTGFVPGLVIAGDRTATGVGGGICQVSTTVFRALYGAGLPIVERRNHSYQVHYYDPQGMDATIYQYSQDLKFTNDTGAALWFQISWDDAHAALEVNVFGKPRAETVQIGKPVTLSTTPSPANRLISDPTMRVGQRRQVDWAAPGAIIQVKRSFLKDGQVVRSDTLTSRYTPWPNIFMVGTKQ
ncbi:VanW family protein [Deinococcus ruber]|uniref:VanW family protein n=1 Tax=Deinococcus ruber TaxID=1848197 RepID=A0A918C2S8_9DEIO|nr:VanW family protein [Deinococcus ruber]GGR02702.1 hypothetical protein GCM10008957_14650 [Deinococcus ruber]